MKIFSIFKIFVCIFCFCLISMNINAETHRSSLKMSDFKHPEHPAEKKLDAILKLYDLASGYPAGDAEDKNNINACLSMYVDEKIKNEKFEISFKNPDTYLANFCVVFFSDSLMKRFFSLQKKNCDGSDTGYICWLDSDPITCAQDDVDSSSYLYHIVSSKGSDSVVIARIWTGVTPYVAASTPREIDYFQMKKESGVWKIASGSCMGMGNEVNYNVNFDQFPSIVK